MRKTNSILFVGLLMAWGWVTSVRAEDSFPPCWRGQVGSTYQNWTFNSAANNPAVPDEMINSNGTASCSLVLGLGATGWKHISPRVGIWDLGQNGTATLTVPNFPAPTAAWKLVQVQVTYLDFGSFGPTTPAVALPGATLLGTNVVNHEGSGFGTWRTQRTLWRLAPAPESETITLSPSISGRSLVLDQIIVDTLCSLTGDGDVPANQPCWRGLPGATFQHWMFGLPNNPSVPELVGNPHGTPTATVVPGMFGAGYLSEVGYFGCRWGMWNIGSNGTITLNIPNDVAAPATAYKYVQVQVTQYRDGIYNANAGVAVSGAVMVGTPSQTTIAVVDTGREWVVQKTLWKLGPPVSSSETVVISAAPNGSVIDQVVVESVWVDPPCPANISVTADPGVCQRAGITWAVPPLDCIVASVTTKLGGGPISMPATLPVGLHSLTTEITDLYGTVRTCPFTVEVKDTEPPTVPIPPPDLTVAGTPGICGANVAYSAVAVDNCPGAVVNFSPPSGSFFPLGLHTVWYQAVDAAGNTNAPATFTVRVVDYSGDVATNVPCWRGQPASTFQQWAFSVSNNPALPELVTNGYGSASLAIDPGLFSSGYFDSESFFGCRQGFWNIASGGSMTITIPNLPAAPPGSYQYARVQVTQYRDGIFNANAPVAVTGGTLVGAPQQSVIEEVDTGREWIVERTVWKIGPPSPATTVLTIQAAPNGSLIDQVVVDTLVVEPPVCPDDILAAADSGACSKTNVTWTAPPAVDGCLVKSASDSPPSGATFPVGVTTVTRTIVDAENHTNTCTFTVTIGDVEPPVITGVSATQVQPYLGVVNVKDCANPTVQGVVNLAVTVTDACGVLVPVIGLTNGPNGEVATFVDQNPAGTFNYLWLVTDTTASGTWTITVSASDGANVATATSSLCVNTRQISGQVELQGFVGTGTVPPHTRAVTFVATETTTTATNILKTWNLTLTNTAGAVFDYTLTDVPAATTHLSAKTAWNLRRKLPVSFVGANATVNFTSSTQLLAGDINGSNNINAVDRTALLGQWGKPAPGNAFADLNGDGNINALDRTRLLGNWGAVGDPQ